MIGNLFPRINQQWCDAHAELLTCIDDAISAAKPPVRGASCAMSNRPVFVTDWKQAQDILIVNRSSKYQFQATDKICSTFFITRLSVLSRYSINYGVFDKRCWQNGPTMNPALLICPHMKSLDSLPYPTTKVPWLRLGNPSDFGGPSVCRMGYFDTVWGICIDVGHSFRLLLQERGFDPDKPPPNTSMIEVVSLD